MRRVLKEDIGREARFARLAQALSAFTLHILKRNAGWMACWHGKNRWDCNRNCFSFRNKLFPYSTPLRSARTVSLVLFWNVAGRLPWFRRRLLITGCIPSFLADRYTDPLVADAMLWVGSAQRASLHLPPNRGWLVTQYTKIFVSKMARAPSGMLLRSDKEITFGDLFDDTRVLYFQNAREFFCVRDLILFFTGTFFLSCSLWRGFLNLMIYFNWGHIRPIIDMINISFT